MNEWRSNPVPVHAIELEQLTHVVAMELNRHNFSDSNFKLDMYRNTALNLVLELRKKILSQRCETKIRKTFQEKVRFTCTINYKIPANRFELFKEFFFPKFLKKRFPVYYLIKRYDIERKVPVHFEVNVGMDLVYPKMVVPDQEHHPVNFRFLETASFGSEPQFYEVNPTQEVIYEDNTYSGEYT